MLIIVYTFVLFLLKMEMNKMNWIELNIRTLFDLANQ